MTSPRPRPNPRATIRTIAAACRVCPMTVSLALRHHRSIPRPTRDRIVKAALSQHYVPDPAVAKLMSHLASRRPVRHQANICVLAHGVAGRRPQGYLDRLLIGMQARAEALGYVSSVLEVDFAELSAANLRRLLLGRGVQGLVLGPMRKPSDLTNALSWQEFSVVSVTPSVLAPKFHVVSPNHFDNMREVCRQLAAAGYRRIGLAMPEDRDLRVRERWTGALAWHYLRGGGEALTPLIDPTFTISLSPTLLAAWIKSQKPDVIVTDLVEGQVVDAVRKLFRPRDRPPVIAMSWPNLRADSGLDQKVEKIGSIAVERLDAMIRNGERGTPETPTITTVDGEWMGIVSADAKPGRDAPHRKRQHRAAFLRSE